MTTPEFLKIKGYKYRAKMLIAAGVALLVVIIIFSLIIHGIASAVRGAKGGKNKDSDTETTASVTESVAESTPAVSSQTQTESAVSSTPVTKKEKFDADGKVIIDTDTLDGKKAIAITFDDGPSEYTQRLVEGLNERGAKATFYMVGSNISKYPDAVRLMANTGHELGNHTYNHTDIVSAGKATANDEITRTDSELIDICGKSSTTFRPPYGSCSDELARGIDKTVMLWSLDTLDWKTRDTKKIKNIIVSQAQDGGVILLHDLYSQSVDGALAAIDELQGEGFVFVTVDELMTRYGYPVSPGMHSAQYAVYETNSPHAGEYAADMERDKQRQEASSAAGTFYYDRADDIDTDSERAQDNTTSEEERDSDSIRVVESQEESSGLVY